MNKQSLKKCYENKKWFMRLSDFSFKYDMEIMGVLVQIWLPDNSQLVTAWNPYPNSECWSHTWRGHCSKQTLIKIYIKSFDFFSDFSSLSCDLKKKGLRNWKQFELLRYFSRLFISLNQQRTCLVLNGNRNQYNL